MISKYVRRLSGNNGMRVACTLSANGSIVVGGTWETIRVYTNIKLHCCYYYNMFIIYRYGVLKQRSKLLILTLGLVTGL